MTTLIKASAIVLTIELAAVLLGVDLAVSGCDSRRLSRIPIVLIPVA